jgi:hypothetical protein
MARASWGFAQEITSVYNNEEEDAHFLGSMVAFCQCFVGKVRVISYIKASLILGILVAYDMFKFSG